MVQNRRKAWVFFRKQFNFSFPRPSFLKNCCLVKQRESNISKHFECTFEAFLIQHIYIAKYISHGRVCRYHIAISWENGALKFCATKKACNSAWIEFEKDQLNRQRQTMNNGFKFSSWRVWFNFDGGMNRFESKVFKVSIKEWAIYKQRFSLQVDTNDETNVYVNPVRRKKRRTAKDLNDEADLIR